MKHSEAFERICQDALKRVTEISPEKVRQMQDSKGPFYFVDVREDCEWAQSRCAGAIHIGRGVIERDIESLIPDHSALVVLYCGGGYRSALAADNIQKMGYTNVFSMQGGIRLWREKGLPEETLTTVK